VATPASTEPNRILAFAVLLSVLLVASPASAQYFGRNKVQFKTLQFQVLETDHFDIYFYPQERAGADISARLAERWYTRLSRIFNHELDGRQVLVLYASHPDFEQTNIIQEELGEGTGGVTEALRRRIVLPFGGPLADTDHVIGHELVHAFQFDMTMNNRGRSQQSGAAALPLWFIEGMAEYLSIGPVDPNTAMWLRDATQNNKLPAIDKLDDPAYFPYRWGQAFWAYVGDRAGDQAIGPMLTTAAGGQVRSAIEGSLGVGMKQLTADWHAAIHRAYDPVLAATATPDATGRRVIVSTGFGSDLNVGPAISPDGRRIAFLSSRSLFSIDLYVAETATGRIVRRLTSTASSPHFASLQFIYSAGAWDTAGRRLTIAAIRSGRPTLAVFDVDSGDTEREIPIPKLDEIFNPTWAPDGHAIAFTGMSQGLTDLYVFDLATSALTRLTNDAFADLQPAWSPDGRRIAFATDRFSTNLQTLALGPYQVGLIDVETAAIERVEAPAGAGSFNPQWSPDGSAIYLISKRGGIPNLYRIALKGGAMAQLTNVSTGLTGITGSSPAMSIASRSGTAAFSVYTNGKYEIRVIDRPTSVELDVAIPSHADVLPPVDRRASYVAKLLADTSLGLPESGDYRTVDYKPRLSLEDIGEPVIAVGASRFGVAFGGGLSMTFGDMLGQHALATALQLGSGFNGNFSVKDTAAQAAYFDMVHRWNWGIVAGQVPYLSGGFQTEVGLTPDGDLVAIDRAILYRQTERGASAVVAYPFSRARRVELNGGLTRISFDQILQTVAYSLYTGHVYVNESEETSLAPTMTFATVGTAFVSDTSNFGAVGPVQGERYRVEAAPTYGSLKFTSLLADYRRYFMPVPFYTVAVRAIHYGRYGNGGEDPRLYPLYLGYPTLVRGYDVNTFDAVECVSTVTSGCPAFDRLMGSRMLVGNLEVRFPLLRPLGVSRRMYGPLPTEVALFADSGVAWNRTEGPSLLGGSRGGVSSVGVSLHVNLGGYAIGQFDFVRPLQRPGKGWVFQFNLAQGF